MGARPEHGAPLLRVLLPLGLRTLRRAPSSPPVHLREVPACSHPRGKPQCSSRPTPPSQPEAAPLNGSDASPLPCGHRLQTDKQQLNNNNNNKKKKKKPTNYDKAFINDHHALCPQPLLQTKSTGQGWMGGEPEETAGQTLEDPHREPCLRVRGLGGTGETEGNLPATAVHA